MCYWRGTCGSAEELGSEGSPNPWAHDPNPVLCTAGHCAPWADPHASGKQGIVFSVSPERCGSWLSGVLWLSQVTQLASYFEPLVSAAVGVASKTLNHQQQMTVLDQSKTLAESALQILYAAKEGGGNPKVRWLCGIKGERGRQEWQKHPALPAVQSRDMFAVQVPVTAPLVSPESGDISPGQDSSLPTALSGYDSSNLGSYRESKGLKAGSVWCMAQWFGDPWQERAALHSITQLRCHWWLTESCCL